MEHIILYPKGIKGANKLPVQDLRQIAKFNHIVINYLMMDRLLKENGTQNKRTSSEA